MKMATQKVGHIQERKNRFTNYPEFNFRLPSLILKLKQSTAWLNNEVTALELMKGSEKCVLLTVVPKDTVIESFQTADSITLQIIDGKLQFQTFKESVLLEKGKSYTFREKARYRNTSLEETVFLLTIKNKLDKSGASRFI